MAADDHPYSDQEGFSLEDILAEFGNDSAPGTPPGSDTPPESEALPKPEASAEPETSPAPETQPEIEPEEPEPPETAKDEEKTPEEPQKEEKLPGTLQPDWREDTIPFTIPPKKEKPQLQGERRTGAVTVFPGPRPPAEREGPPERPVAEEKDLPSEAPKDLDETKVLEFPAPEQPNPVAAGIDQLRRQADEFAGHMFEEEGLERDQEVRRAERLIPGVDEEEPAPAVRERKPRRSLPKPPDLSPAELTKRYAKGLKGLRVRTLLVFLLFPLELYLTLIHVLPFAIPQLPFGEAALRCYLMAAVQALALLLGADAFLRGLVRPFRRRTGMDTIVSLADLFVLADALTLPTLAGDGALPREPFCAVSVLSLAFVMLGELKKRRGQRLSCRTAASASEPYLVTRDEGKWNGRDTYAKWSGPVSGFGSQIQDEDGAERIYRAAAPVLIVACAAFSLISSVGRERREDLLWCLAATFSGAASLSATLCFGLPWRKLSERLAKSGAALAGWQGVTNTTGSANLLLTDIDLFPVGSVTLNGVKIFGDFPIDKVIADTATVIRDSGSGLEKVFYDLLRSQGALYRRGEEFTAYEGGGASEVIRDELVLVGSASFMVLMDVALPPGLKVKNAVFCAIDGELAGIFALNYHLPGTVAPAIDALLRNKLTPVLCTRDFNLIPAMLRQRFKLPAERMEFPSVERRRELSDREQDHSDTLTAVLCREGIYPFAEAVVGGRRLRAAVRLSAAVACVGAAVGAALCFYLTFVHAYASLTPLNLLVFLLMWLVPTFLISAWVDRY